MGALAAGDVVPEIELKTAEGEARKLSELVADGPALLAFYKVTCPTCQLTLPYLERLKGGPMKVIAVSQDDAERSAEFNQFFEVHLETMYDREEDGYAASNALGITHVPTLFVVEPDGKLGWTWTGFSRAKLEELGQRAGRAMFGPGDKVPETKFG